MKAKVIWHVAGYTRNFGDFVLIESIRQNLRDQSDIPLEFVNIDCQNTHFYNEVIEKLNKEADLLLIGGGGFVFHRHEDNSISGWQWSIFEDNIYKIKVPIVVYGIGFNKFFYDDRGFKENMNINLRVTQECSKLFSVRNYGTKNELVNRGLVEKGIEVIPDAGMFLKGEYIDIPELNNDRMKIGLNFVEDRPYYTYPEISVDTRKIVINNLIIALKYYVKNYDALIINIEHILDLDKDVNNILKKELGKNFYSLTEIGSKIYPPSLLYAPFLVNIYEKMDFVIGMRGHSNIIPFGRGIPFIALGSHDKNRFFLEDIGEDYIIDIRNYKNSCESERIIEIIDKLKNDTAYYARTSIKRSTNNSLFINFNQKVLDLLM